MPKVDEEITRAEEVITILRQSVLPKKMTTNKVEFFYYPVFKESLVPIDLEIERKIQRYFKCHSDVKPQKVES